MSEYTLYCGDCLEVMPSLPDKSVHAIIADIPYGTTACAWDTVIPFAPMWAQLKRLIKPRGAIALFGSQPFTSALVMSNAEWFHQSLVWRKNVASNFLNCNKMHMAIHEDVSIFCDAIPTFNKVYTYGKPYTQSRAGNDDTGDCYGAIQKRTDTVNCGERNPVTVLEYSRENGLHPTQKPVALMEYLIRTYTNEGETVLDFTMGSGTTGVACMSTGRNFIGIEQDAGYFEIAQERIADAARVARKEFRPMTGGVKLDELPLFAEVR